MKRSPSPRAFTLVELLAVISIVVVLVSLLFPMVQKSRMSARSAACIHNLKGIGAAFQMYAAENNGLLPAMRWRVNDPPAQNPNPSKKGWQIEINPYLEVNDTSYTKMAEKMSSGAVFCPEFMRDYKMNSDIRDRNCLGYGMTDVSGKSFDNRVPMASLEYTANFILIGDSDDYHLGVSATTWENGQDENGRYASGDPIRHGKTANYLFADGHITPLTQQLAQETLIKQKKIIDDKTGTERF